MKKKKQNFDLLIIFLGSFLITIHSCTKEEAPSKKETIITWSNPADINYGIKLSNIQLNATADATGTFVYTPAIMSKLNEGLNQDLRVDFTPTDASKYTNANKIVKINVFAAPTLSDISDIDGNVYKIVTIGSQVWMAENLRTTKYKDGSLIPNIKNKDDWEMATTGAFCTYNNTSKADSISTYGLLYNWYAVNTGKIAPVGWHIPSDDEWNILINYLGNNYNAGGRLKETGTKHWLTPNLGANNERGFTALPSGGRYGHMSEYMEAGRICGFWSSTTYPFDNHLAWSYFVYYSDARMDKGNYLKQNGYAVRCIRD